MGCDIHMVVQFRKDGVWLDAPVVIAAPWGDPWWELRDYVTFGVLAGVRDKQVPRIADPRGFPEDFDNTVDPLALDAVHHGKWMGDHSFSWVTLAELKAVKGYARKMSLIPEWVPELERLGAPEDVRIVFGFDS